jgi:hypothetical protein
MLKWIVGIILVVAALAWAMLATFANMMADAQGDAADVRRAWLLGLVVAGVGVAIIVWG